MLMNDGMVTYSSAGFAFLPVCLRGHLDVEVLLCMSQQMHKCCPPRCPRLRHSILWQPSQTTAAFAGGARWAAAAAVQLAGTAY